MEQNHDPPGSNAPCNAIDISSGYRSPQSQPTNGYGASSIQNFAAPSSLHDPTPSSVITAKVQPPPKPVLRIRKVRLPKTEDTSLLGQFGAQSTWADKKPSTKVDSRCLVKGCKHRHVHRDFPITNCETKTSWLGDTQTSVRQGVLNICSRFCRDHTCRSGGYGRGGRFCECPKDPGERRCACCVVAGREE